MTDEEHVQAVRDTVIAASCAIYAARRDGLTVKVSDSNSMDIPEFLLHLVIRRTTPLYALGEVDISDPEVARAWKREHGDEGDDE